jgi:hypothetical protein
LAAARIGDGLEAELTAFAIAFERMSIVVPLLPARPWLFRST